VDAVLPSPNKERSAPYRGKKKPARGQGKPSDSSTGKKRKGGKFTKSRADRRKRRSSFELTLEQGLWGGGGETLPSIRRSGDGRGKGKKVDRLEGPSTNKKKTFRGKNPELPSSAGKEKRIRSWKGKGSGLHTFPKGKRTP